MAARSLLRPKWLAGHLLALVTVVAFVNLGLWQLDRLDERQARNQAIAARSDATPRPVEELIDPSIAIGDPAAEDLRYRSATATGRYRVTDEVLVANRSLDGAPGYHVLTPLVLDDGSVLIVQRGFLPFNTPDLDATQEAAQPPDGVVTVTGLLFPTQRREGIGPRDPAEGRLRQIARVDLGRLQQQIDGDLLPLYLQLTEQSPAPGPAAPQLLDLPDQSEGPHLGYAVQWFAFTAVVLVGYPLLLVRTVRGQRRRRPIVSPGLGEGPPSGAPGTAGLSDG